MLLKGENAVTAVAKVYSVVRNISAHHMQQLKCPLPNGLIADLDQYMEGGTCYDVLLDLARSMTSDLRNLAGQTWKKSLAAKSIETVGLRGFLVSKKNAFMASCRKVG